MGVSRRAVLQAAAGGALALGAGRASAEGGGEDLQSLYEAAKKEGQVTWYSGFLDQPIVVRVGNAFSQKWPGIAVNATKTTSQVGFQRVLQDMKGGQVQSDVFSSTDVSHLDYLQKKGLLIHFVPPNAKGMVPALQNFDPKGDYYVAWVGVAAIGYNTNKVSAAESPKDWPDLADPKWKDKVAFGSPIYSGMVGNWTVAMAEKYGWDYFKKLNSQNPLVGRSIDDAVTVLNSGERVVALVSVASALRSANKGNPLAVNYPTSGTLAVPSPAAVIKGCKSPNAGKLFLDFLCGPEYSQILAEEFEQPLRADVPAPKGSKSLAEVTVLSPTLSEIEKTLPANKDKWKETFS
jgi:iron(III) transport system substrate-binding protein